MLYLISHGPNAAFVGGGSLPGGGPYATIVADLSKRLAGQWRKGGYILAPIDSAPAGVPVLNTLYQG